MDSLKFVTKGHFPPLDVSAHTRKEREFERKKNAKCCKKLRKKKEGDREGERKSFLGAKSWFCFAFEDLKVSTHSYSSNV